MRAEIKELIETLTQVFKSLHQRSYHKLENKNLYPGQPKLLSLIKAHEGITQKDLSRLNFVTPATITGMLNKLEANNYVYRVSDTTDKRIMRVYLTPEGHHIATEGEILMISIVEDLFEGFTEEELQNFLSYAKKLKYNLNKHNS